MKVLGFERDNTTQLSTADPSGFPYSASFELYPFHEGRDYAVYKGILNGAGPRRGEFCVVKAGLHKEAGPADWHVQQAVVRRAHALAADFNALVQTRAISFEWPLVAAMDTVSDFTPLVRLFKRHHKHLSCEETVVIEDLLEGEFQTFSSSFPWVYPHSHETEMTQAFSHFTWHATRQLVVCGLQGVARGGRGGVQLTTPTIHSTSLGQHGPRDGGLAGISEFFASHRCNAICSSWPGPDVPAFRGHGGDRLHVHHQHAGGAKRAHNPRRNCGGVVEVLPPSPLAFVPKVPSAPTIEMTRF